MQVPELSLDQKVTTALCPMYLIAKKIIFVAA